MKVQNRLLLGGRNLAFLVMFSVVFILVVVASARIAEASTLNQVIISDTLNSDRSIIETISITMTNNTDSTFSLTLPAKAQNIYYNDVRLESPNITQPLDCANCSIKIRYSMTDLITRLSMDTYSFYRTVSIPQTPQDFKYVIYLPKGYLVENLTDPNSGNVLPMPTDVLSDGESIILVWNAQNPQFPQQYLVKYTGHEVGETFVQSLEDLGHLSVLIALVFMLLIGIFLGMLYQRRGKERRSPAATHSKIPSSLLSPDEKTVIEFLKKKGAQKTPVNQKLIGRELNWSKSKTSGVLANLTYKKIIEKEKLGRNYEVKLVKEVE